MKRCLFVVLNSLGLCSVLNTPAMCYGLVDIERKEKTAVFICTAFTAWNLISNSISYRTWHATDMCSLVMAVHLQISEALLNKLDIQVTVWCFPIILIPTLHFQRSSPFGEALDCSLEVDSQWYSTLPPSNRGCSKIQVAQLAFPYALFWMPHSVYNKNELSVSTASFEVFTHKVGVHFISSKNRQNIHFQNLLPFILHLFSSSYQMTKNSYSFHQLWHTHFYHSVDLFFFSWTS